jgi:GNAT superfamily N-acetyltransferase
MDHSKLVQILADAFWDDPMFSELFYGRNKRKQISGLFEYLIKRNALIGGDLYTDGKTYAALLDKRLPVPFHKQLLLLFEMITLSFKLPIKSLNQLTAYQKITFDHAPKGAHYYLTIIGVAPSAQGTGIGSKVLTTIHDNLPPGLTIALDTENEKNVPYYEKFGYTTNHIDTVSECTIFCMSRSQQS